MMMMSTTTSTLMSRIIIGGLYFFSKSIQSTRALSSSSSAHPNTYIGALDQGTSSTRFVLFDKQGDIVASEQKEHTQIYPHPGWVEHRPLEIWDRSLEVMTDVMKSLPDDAQVASIGITNQRETTVVWDKETGEPLCNAVVWNCARTGEIVHELQEQLGGVDALRHKTGLPISTYFSATKLKWMMGHVPGLKEKCMSGEAIFGTIDCWLTWKLTNGQVHATDITNAARTLLCDVGTLKWDDELLNLFEIPKTMLPAIEPSIGGDFGFVSKEACPALADVPIGAILGDQHAATFGQTCFEKGQSKCTFGTGAFIMMNTGAVNATATDQTSRPLVSTHGLLTTPFYQRKGEPPVYALEGAVAVAGSLIQWLRDNLEFGDSAKQLAELAATVESAEGVRFVPAFNGLFAPHWKEDARGIICGLTAFHTKAHIARAAIDAASFQTQEVFEAMEKDSGINLTALKVDGGMTANEQLLEFLADLLDTEVLRPKCLETTALGVAFGAGLSSGVWSSLDEISKLYEVEKIVDPKMSEEDRTKYKRSWKKAIDRSMGWED